MRHQLLKNPGTHKLFYQVLILQAGYLLLSGQHYIFLMSLAIWKVWIKSFEKKLLKIYFIHLFFNSTWSVVFFGFHLIGIALINLVIILMFIIILMKQYLSRDKMSFYLMIPYLVWSSYALILNSSIFLLN